MIQGKRNDPGETWACTVEGDEDALSASCCRGGCVNTLWFHFSHLKWGNMSPVAQNQIKMDMIVMQPQNQTRVNCVYTHPCLKDKRNHGPHTLLHGHHTLLLFGDVMNNFSSVWHKTHGFLVQVLHTSLAGLRLNTQIQHPTAGPRCRSKILQFFLHLWLHSPCLPCSNYLCPKNNLHVYHQPKL